MLQGACRGQIFKVKRVRFWSGAQERCLHNSTRQMNGIFQSAALSIRRLWSVPTSQEIPNKKGGKKIWCEDLGGKVDVCILHKNMLWFSPKLCNGSVIYGPNEKHEEPEEEEWVKCSCWSVTAELLCRLCKAVISICIRGFSHGCLGQTPAKCNIVKQASRRWMESESLNHSCRGGGLQSAPYLPFLIILNNLQFKEKSGYPVSHHQIMFLEVKSRFFFHVLELVENSLLTAQSVDIQHMSRLKGFAPPTDVFGTMGRQMSRPFTPHRGYEGNGGEGNSEERPFSYYSN